MALPIKSRRTVWVLLTLSSLLGVLGYLGAWWTHPAAGLVITGLDLGEYVKFLPQVASGQIRIERTLFYFPLLATSLIWVVAGSRRVLPKWLRGLAIAGSIPVALAMLPPAWSPQSLRAAEFRVQLLAIALCLAAVVASPLLRRISDRPLLLPGALLGLAAAVAPASSFGRIIPLLRGLYGTTGGIGWGVWITALGFAVVSLIAIGGMLFFERRRLDSIV